jgi:hypothetical protein
MNNKQLASLLKKKVVKMVQSGSYWFQIQYTDNTTLTLETTRKECSLDITFDFGEDK